jgi:hypothetical protein
MHALLAAILLFGLVNLASAQIMPPPARYDHPYRGRLDVIRTRRPSGPCKSGIGRLPSPAPYYRASMSRAAGAWP